MALVVKIYKKNIGKILSSMTLYVFKTYSAGIFTSLLEIDIIIYHTDGNTKIVLSAMVGLIIDTLRC